MIFACVALCVTVAAQSPIDGAAFSAVGLEKAYKKNDSDELDRILGRWARESNDVLKKRARSRLEITTVAEDIYTAICERHLPGPDSKQYFLVPDAVEVIVVSDFTKYDDPQSIRYLERTTTQVKVDHADRVTIHDFAPKALASNKRILLSDESHSEELLRFLSSKPNAVIDERWSLDNKTDESRKRSKFLNGHLQVREGSWGGGWSWLSQPTVGRIFVNTRFDDARAFVSHGADGILTVRKQNGKWVAAQEAVRRFIE